MSSRVPPFSPWSVKEARKSTFIIVCYCLLLFRTCPMPAGPAASASSFDQRPRQDVPPVRSAGSGNEGPQRPHPSSCHDDAPGSRPLRRLELQEMDTDGDGTDAPSSVPAHLVA